MNLEPKLFQETKSFQNFNEAATYLKEMYDRTKAEKCSQVKIKCQFHGKFIKEVKCYFDHDYEKKIPPGQLASLMTFSKLFKKGIGIYTGNKKTDVFEIKLKSSTLTKGEMKEFEEALSIYNLAAGIIIHKGFVGKNVQSEQDLIPVGIAKQMNQKENAPESAVK